MPGTTIIPIASGKGGVGKSFFTANLAISLARLGNRTIAVDLDLGASNLHSYLNIPNEYPGIGDFLKTRQSTLSDLQVSTSFPNLTIITGDGLSPHMANISHGEKIKLIKNIKNLSAEFVLLDLSAGSTFNTLDFFSVANNGIIMIKPELPAILNILVYLKNLVYRLIEREVRKEHAILNYVRDVFRKSIKEDPLPVAKVIETIILEDEEVGKKVKTAIQKIKPRLILNFGDNPEELIWLQKIEKSIVNNMSISVEHFGYVPFDPAVKESINQNTPVMIAQPESMVSQGILRIANRIMRRWNEPIDKSWERLKQDTIDFSEGFSQPHA